MLGLVCVGIITVSLTNLAISEEIVVPDVMALQAALNQINGNGDNDNTIIISQNTSFTNSVSWPTNEKRIFIQTKNDVTVTFEQNVTIPNRVKLVIDTPDAVFSDGFRIASGIEIRNTQAVTGNVAAGNLQIDGGMLKASGENASLAGTGNTTVDNNGELVVNGGATAQMKNLILGEDTDSHGSALVTGNGSKLIVNNPGAALSQSPAGTGVLNVTGGGTVDMRGTGKIVFNGNALFDSGRLIQQADSVLDAGSGRIDFDNGSVVTSAGTLQAGSGVFVNDHSVLKVTDSNGTLKIRNGGLYFSDTSTLGITLGKDGNAVTSGKIDAGSNLVALDGTLLVTPEYRYYGTAPITTQIITNTTSSITGEFDNARLSQNRFGTIDVNYSVPHSVSLTYNPSETPYSSITETFNERSVGQTFDAIYRQQLANFDPLMQATWDMSDSELRALYNDLSGEIRAETMAMPLATPGRMAFDRVGWDSATGHVFFGPQYRLAAYGSRRAAWIRPYYLNNKIDSDGNASDYTMDGYGFVGGVDQTLVGGKTAVGVMLGYGRPELKTRNDKAELDDFVVGAYLATRIFDAYELKFWGGYGYQYYDMQRHINSLGTPQTFRSNFEGHTGTVSAELSRPIYTMSRLVLKPTVGYDGLFLTQNANEETGDSLVALAFDKTNIERHIGRIGLGAEYGDSARSLYGGAYYKYLLGGDEVYYSQASFVGGGPSFIVEGVDLGKSFISANIGLQINLSDDRSRLIFIDYTGDFGDHSAYYQMATVGLQQTF